MNQAEFPDSQDAQVDTSFGDILTEFEQAHHAHGATLDGTVVSVTAEGAFVDIGRKMEGVLTIDPKIPLKPGMKVVVSIRGRDENGNYLLSTIKVDIPKDWSGLEAAFQEKKTIGGTVTELVKGGFRVDVGMRAFMPASRSGVREQADMEKLVGQTIECRITKLDTATEDIVVDRRVIVEEHERQTRQQAFEHLQEGTIVQGTVRSLTDFGAFVDLGGVDGLLHVADMSWVRGVKPSEVVKAGETLDVKILKINRETRKIGLGLKQLSADPWTLVGDKYPPGTRIKGKVARVTDFGAFVELEPGIEGLVHASEMSWTKRNVKPSTILKEGEQVEVVVLSVSAADKRVGLGLKQVLGDPWAEALKKYPAGSIVEAPVTSLAKFGAFVDVGDGIEGMIHIGDIALDKRLNHPNEVLKVGEKVRAQVLEADKERRRFRLGIKQLLPTSVDEYIADHKVGDVVTGRIVDASPSRLKVELGEGVMTTAKAPERKQEVSAGREKADLSSLTAKLSARWKSGTGAEAGPEALRSGEIRSFKITSLDPAAKKVEVELVP